MLFARGKAAAPLAVHYHSLDRTQLCDCQAAGKSRRLSVAAGARNFLVLRVIYLADTVPDKLCSARFAGEWVAQVVRAGADYEASMVAGGSFGKGRKGWTTAVGRVPGRDMSTCPFRVMEKATRQIGDGNRGPDDRRADQCPAAGFGGRRPLPRRLRRNCALHGVTAPR